MSVEHRNGQTIIHGKNPIKPNEIVKSNQLETKFNGGRNVNHYVNGAAIERKEEAGALSFPLIPRNIALAIQAKRKELGLNKQTDLQAKCQVPIDIIKAIESQTLQLTPANRQHLHKVARTLGMPALNLPKM
jgi:hypothetical protein